MPQKYTTITVSQYTFDRLAVALRAAVGADLDDRFSADGKAIDMSGIVFQVKPDQLSPDADGLCDRRREEIRQSSAL